MTAYELFIDTARYYGEDTSRRSVNNNGDCVYQSDCGNRCAIGRYLERYEKEMEGGGPQDVRFAMSDEIVDIKSIDLTAIQIFHDRSSYWNEKEGLTSDGQIYFKKLCRRFRNDE